MDDIIIFPNGDAGNKLLSLMAALDLQLRVKKNSECKIKLIYSYSYNDLIFDNKENDFMDQLPDFNFKNVSYVYEKKNFNVSSSLLTNILTSEHIKETSNTISKNTKKNIKKFGIEYNEYPLIKSGIIKNTWIMGFKNKGAHLIKEWLSDITKFKYYNKFIETVGFDWYDDKFEYVVIYLEIGGILKFIQTNTIANKFILSPDWYDKALKILKNKAKKPLKIIFYNNLRLDTKLLFKYLQVIEKYGEIINSKMIYSNQITKLLVMSKVDHYIGSRNLIQVGSYLYAKKHSITIINSHNVIEYPYRKNDCPKDWIILNDSNYRISSIRDMARYDLDILVGLSSTKTDESKEINKKLIHKSKNIISSKYAMFYENYNKALESKFLRDLMLFRNFEYKYKNTSKIYYLNSNISINEGLFLYHLIKKYKPKNLLEIGLACGISASFMLLAMDKKSKLTSVDPFQKYQWDSFGLVVIDEIIKENKLPKSIHSWAPYYSHKFFSLKNKNYDFCFIDGDHSYEGTMIDLEGCHELLKKNGILVIDDVLHYDVKKALHDFLIKYNDIYSKINNELRTMTGYIKIK